MRSALAALAVLLVAAPLVLNAEGRASTSASPGAHGAPRPPERSDYERRARRELDDLRGRLDEAEREASTLGEAARKKAQRRVASLDKRLDQAQKQASELQRSEERRWTVVRKHLDSTMASLRREYEGLRKDLDKQRKKR